MEKIAIVHFVNSPKGQSRSGMAAVMRYAAQEQKTLWQGQSLVSGVNCQAKSAYDDFLSTKLLHHKESGRLYYHLVQSFPKDALVDPVAAHQAAVRLAGFQDREVLVCTHVDREHIHSHLIINSVSMDEGRKLHVSQRELEELRRQNDLICKELNLPMFEKGEHTQTSALSGGEYHAAARGESWKFQLMNAIDRCMTRAATRKEFLSLMKDLGYQVRWSDSRTSITYTTPKGMKCRDNRLHEPKYLKGAMELEFTIRAAILTGRTQRAKFPSAEEPASGESDTGYSGAAHCDSVLSAQRDGADTSEPSQSGAECGTTDRTAEPQSRSSETSSHLYAINQTLTEMDKSLQQIQWMVRQAGNRNEKRFSLPSLTFPHLKWSPVYGLILISAAALLAILFTWVVLWK